MINKLYVSSALAPTCTRTIISELYQCHFGATVRSGGKRYSAMRQSDNEYRKKGCGR